MAKKSTVFVCQACGHEASRWAGRCPGCEAWNTLVEEVRQETPKGRARKSSAAPSTVTLAEVSLEQTPRTATGLSELDRILGGGLVRGAILLLGGEPGVGKSTLLLAMVGALDAKGVKTLYVSGEESLEQIGLRARRLGVRGDGLHLLGETRLEEVIAAREALRPDVMVVDSIQTLVSADLTSAAGSVSQIREVAGRLQEVSKQTGCIIWLVGHVTKDGNLAGPKVLEHIVDTVIYFEGEGRHPYRVLRAVKNRFGATHEVGLFEMSVGGLQPVANPSKLLLAERPLDASGTVVVATVEGSRPLLVEVQALAARTAGGTPRRAAQGVDPGRVSLLAAVIEKVGTPLYDRDLFVNAVGGIRISEPAADLGIVMAICSAVADKAIPHDLLVVGEVGLTGEVRGVRHLELRLQEAARHGFKRAIIPPRVQGPGRVDLEVLPVRSVNEALEIAFTAGRARPKTRD